MFPLFEWLYKLTDLWIVSLSRKSWGLSLIFGETQDAQHTTLHNASRFTIWPRYTLSPWRGSNKSNIIITISWVRVIPLMACAHRVRHTRFTEWGAWGQLAAYIFGKNMGKSGKSETIAMTTPVKLEPFALTEEDEEEEAEDVDDRYERRLTDTRERSLEKYTSLLHSQPHVKNVQCRLIRLCTVSWPVWPPRTTKCSE
jgi:hypothetical protein